VTIDETKFTDEWMKEFRSYMYNFQTIEDHVKHIARNLGDPNLEGYSYDELGIKCELVSESEEFEGEYIE
jgi:hypothetical protein